MSQVVVTRDRLKDKRDQSLAQEHTIDNFSRFEKWKRSDATKTLLAERLIAVLAAPIAAFWGVLFAALGSSLTASMALFRILSAFWPNRKPPHS